MTSSTRRVVLAQVLFAWTVLNGGDSFASFEKVQRSPAVLEAQNAPSLGAFSLGEASWLTRRLFSRFAISEGLGHVSLPEQVFYTGDNLTYHIEVKLLAGTADIPWEDCKAGATCENRIDSRWQPDGKLALQWVFPGLKANSKLRLTAKSPVPFLPNYEVEFPVEGYDFGGDGSITLVEQDGHVGVGALDVSSLALKRLEIRDLGYLETLLRDVLHVIQPCGPGCGSANQWVLDQVNLSLRQTVAGLLTSGPTRDRLVRSLRIQTGGLFELWPGVQSHIQLEQFETAVNSQDRFDTRWHLGVSLPDGTRAHSCASELSMEGAPANGAQTVWPSQPATSEHVGLSVSDGFFEQVIRTLALKGNLCGDLTGQARAKALTWAAQYRPFGKIELVSEEALSAYVLKISLKVDLEASFAGHLLPLHANGLEVQGTLWFHPEVDATRGLLARFDGVRLDDVKGKIRAAGIPVPAAWFKKQIQIALAKDLPAQLDGIPLLGSKIDLGGEGQAASTAAALGALQLTPKLVVHDHHLETDWAWVGTP